MSTSEVIEALGGSRAVTRLTGRGLEAVCNWRNRPGFPPNTYLAMTQALAAKGLFAPAWLWNMEPRPPAPLPKADTPEVA